MFVALIGIDGAGKTTAAEAARDYFDRRRINTAKVSAFGYFLLKPLLFAAKLLNKGGKETGLHPNPLLRAKNKSPFLKIWPFLALLDNWFYFFLKLKCKLSKNSFLIADKYFYDMAGSFLYFGYSTEKIDAFYTNLIPRPDLVLVLDLPAEEAFYRKKELNPDYYDKQRKYYLNLAKRLNFCIINAGRPLAAVVEEIISKIKERQDTNGQKK